MVKDLRAISLDFWGTVATPNPEYSLARTRYLAQLFDVDDSEADHRYKQVKRHQDYMAEKFGVASTPYSCMKQLIERHKTLSRNTSIADILSEMRVLANEYPPHVSLTMMNAINSAAAEFVICITSNTNFIPGSLLRKTLQFTRIKHFTFSDEVGVSKPCADIFHMTRLAIIAERACRMENIIHIGDHPICDGRGALDAGMISRVIKNPEHTVEVLNNLIQDTC